MGLKQLTKETVIRLFSELDSYFASKNKSVKVTLLGGVAALIQGYIDRTTRDIDVAPIQDAVQFREACHLKNIAVDIVTVGSLASYDEKDTNEVFKGTSLTLRSVNYQDLIKMKLERFEGHDREDIHGIIKTTSLGYDEFKKIVADALIDYIGRKEKYIISAGFIVEDLYPKFLEDFEKAMQRSR